MTVRKLLADVLHAKAEEVAAGGISKYGRTDEELAELAGRIRADLDAEVGAFLPGWKGEE